MAHEEDEPHSVEQAAKILGVHPVTVRRLIRERAITAERPGKRKWIITKTALSIYRESIRSQAHPRRASAEKVRE